jgi:hypothetical protein
MFQLSKVERLLRSESRKYEATTTRLARFVSVVVKGIPLGQNDLRTS